MEVARSGICGDQDSLDELVEILVHGRGEEGKEQSSGAKPDQSSFLDDFGSEKDEEGDA